MKQHKQPTHNKHKQNVSENIAGVWCKFGETLPDCISAAIWMRSATSRAFSCFLNSAGDSYIPCSSADNAFHAVTGSTFWAFTIFNSSSTEDMQGRTSTCVHGQQSHTSCTYNLATLRIATHDNNSYVVAAHTNQRKAK